MTKEELAAKLHDIERGDFEVKAANSVLPKNILESISACSKYQMTRLFKHIVPGKGGYRILLENLSCVPYFKDPTLMVRRNLLICFFAF